MRTKATLILSGFILMIASCTSDKPNLPSEAKPSPESSVSALPSDSANVEPSSNAEPTPVPTPPLPTPSPFPTELIGKSYYTPKIPCKEINSSDISEQMLTAPRDIAVRQDGKEIYITFRTAFINGYRSGSDWYTLNRKLIPRPIDRTYLYRMKVPDESAPSVVNIDQDFSFSCGFNGEIEMDSDNQLIITFPEMDHRMDLQTFEAPIKAHHYYRLNTESLQIQKFATQQLEPIFRGWGQPGSDARRIINMHLDLATGDIYVYLDSSIPIVDDQLIRLAYESQLFSTLLLVFNPGYFMTPILPISAKPNNIIIAGTKSYSGYFPQITRDASQRLETSDINCPKIKNNSYIWMSGNPKLDKQGNAFFTGQVFNYDGTYKNIASFIWKQTPDNQITCIAGNGKNAYLDGKGLEASFNKPSELDIDAAGNIYVADTDNHAIRKITPKGKVSTLYKTPDNVN